MSPASLSRATLALLLVAFLAGGFLLGSAITVVVGDPGATPSPSLHPSAQVTPGNADLPERDVDGDDLERLPRYPGSVRTEYGISVDERFRLTAVEYMTDASIEEVRAFYWGVMDEHGWDRADVNYAAGEWTYVLVDGPTEALIQIELWNGLVEVDLQISEPRRSSPEPTPDPTPEPTRRPTPVPMAPPPAPPPSGADDDDDSDDSDDDWSDWSASDDD